MPARRGRPAKTAQVPADRQFMTEKEVATLLRVVPSSVRAMRARGELAYLKLGDPGVKRSRVIYPRADVERFIGERLQAARPKAA